MPGYLKVLLLSILLMPLFASAKPGDYLVLVPGTFAKWLPGSQKTYFSPEILKVIQQNSYRAIVIGGLEPTGELSSNGQIIFKKLQNMQAQGFFEKGYNIHLLGHSAGGFYALKVAELNGQSPSPLPIRSIVMLGTPLQGTPIVDVLLDKGILGKILRAQLKAIDAIFFDTKGLYELSSSQVAAFLQKLRLPSNLFLLSLTTSQTEGPIWDANNSSYLSPVYAITSQFYEGVSDGLIPDKVPDGDFRISQIPVRSYAHFSVPLDHAELVLDSRVLALAGARDVQVVRDGQQKFYSDFLRLLPAQ